MNALLLGITGSIASYKSCELVRLLIKRNIKVQVIMTPFAVNFVGKMTFAALTGYPVLTEFTEEGAAFAHISLAQQNDLFLIAPCDANTLSKLAYGIADNLLTTTALAFQSRLVLAPAMNSRMWENTLIQENVRRLEKRGVKVLPTSKDLLACQEEGFGKMLEPKEILQMIKEKEPKRGEGKLHVLISAGATREYLDPVRYISNGSSGKMGLALAEAASAIGASVFAVVGDTKVSFESFPHKKVETGKEMQRTLEAKLRWADIVLMAAAVADFQVAHSSKKKLSRKKQVQLQLEPTKDILASLAQKKAKKTLLVGFCLSEQKELLKKAREKLKKKRLDCIVANPLESMNSEKTAAYFIFSDGKVQKKGKQSKMRIAKSLMNELVNLPRRLK